MNAIPKSQPQRPCGCRDTSDAVLAATTATATLLLHDLEAALSDALSQRNSFVMDDEAGRSGDPFADFQLELAHDEYGGQLSPFDALYEEQDSDIATLLRILERYPGIRITLSFG